MYNRIILLGRLTKDPELRSTQGGVSVCSFTVACDRPYSKGKERQADFINCVAWRSLGEFISQYFSKGKPILLEGRMQTESYTDRNGEKRYKTDVVVEKAQFVSGEKQNSTPTQPLPQAGDDYEEVDTFSDLPF